MSTKLAKTKFIPKEQAQAERKWVLVDAENQVVGRVASKISDLLRGKHKATYSPHQDNGDFVVVVNAKKLVFTGNKAEDKSYYDHSLYPGGVREEKAGVLLNRAPDKLLERVVWGMMPKTTLGRQMLKKLRVFPGAEHPYIAQQPVSQQVGRAAPKALSRV